MDDSTRKRDDRTIDFTPRCVQEYLDNCIRYWRNNDSDYAKYYVDAFQSIRSSMFGEALPKDLNTKEKNQGPLV